MSYQSGYQYSNVPSAEEHSNTVADGAAVSGNNIADSQQQQQQQQAYHQQYHQYNTSDPNNSSNNKSYLASYHDYIQSTMNTINHHNSEGIASYFELQRRKKKNRIIVGSVALFFLFLILHHGKRATSGSSSDGGNINSNSNSNTQSTSASTTASTNNNNSNNNHAVTNNQNPTFTFLLTYPMSGTTYTMELIHKATSIAIATNDDKFNPYRDPNNNDNNIRPICMDYPSLTTTSTNTNDNNDNNELHVGYPIWTHSFENGSLPSNSNILTLSHCSGYCMTPCSPMEYVHTISSFEESCRQIIINNNNQQQHQQQQGQQIVSYMYIPQDKIKGVIHLIRDPLSNIVSRFHEYVLMNQNWLQQQQQQGGENSSSSSSQQNFKSWCHEIDTSNTTLLELEQSSHLFSTEMKHLMKTIPCHSEFVKYILWHNNVVEMSWSSGLNSIQVYFEDFANDNVKHLTVEEMTKFLGYELKSSDLPVFLGERKYREGYYTEDEVKALMVFIRYMSVGNTWDYLKRYFEGLE